MSHFLIRVDGSPEIGAGHVMRCLTLAESLEKIGPVTFLSAHLTPSLTQRIEQAGHQWVPLANMHDMLPIVARASGARALIVDSYALDSRWRQVAHALGCPVVALDDLCDRDLWADFIINGASGADDLPYERFGRNARLLLGPSYALVSRSIRQWRNFPAGQGGYVLLTFGGSDPLALTLPVVEKLRSLPLLAILGGSTPDRDWVAERLRRLGVMVQVDSNDMGQWIRKARLVVTAAGSTLNEVAVLGRPAVAVVVADNQRFGAERAAANGWVEMVDGRRPDAVAAIADTALALWNDRARCDQLAMRAAQQTDGAGADRIVAELSGALTDRMV